MEGDVQGGRALHAMGEGCGKTKSFAVPACMGYQVTGIQQEGGIVAPSLSALDRSGSECAAGSC